MSQPTRLGDLHAGRHGRWLRRATTLDAGATLISIDLNVRYLRPVTVPSGVLRAVGTVTKPGKRVAYASAEIRDARDKLVATATSSLFIIDSTLKSQAPTPLP
ncbi:MAG: hypothetical protein QOI70_86 [Microbacteriaceae bacterium]|nr:hypothetical protein [Microbacteriaceae bacterium]